MDVVRPDGKTVSAASTVATVAFSIISRPVMQPPCHSPVSTSRRLASLRWLASTAGRIDAEGRGARSGRIQRVVGRARRAPAAFLLLVSYLDAEGLRGTPLRQRRGALSRRGRCPRRAERERGGRSARRPPADRGPARQRIVQAGTGGGRPRRGKGNWPGWGGQTRGRG